MNSWETLGNVAPRDLVETRLQLHWAAQLVAAVGASLVPAKPDDSHTALTSLPDRSLLVSAAIDSSPPRRVALSVPDFRILVLDGDLAEVAAFALDGSTLLAARDRLASELGVSALNFPDYDMPAHPIQDGAAFRFAPPPSFEELAHWFDNGAGMLRGLDLGEDRCWPHHFDLACLLELGGGKTIGVGLSPGDGSYDEPYWYVSPYPTSDELPALPIGHWHREDFVAAILTGSDITAAGDGAEQQSNVDAFLEAVISLSRQLLA